MKCGHNSPSPCPICLLQAPLPSVQLGAFVLEDEIGRGGMGVVYRARDTRIDRVCAVKLLDSPREARALARLNHPNIVTLFEAGEIEGQSYLAMELVEGRSLASLALTSAQALDVCIDVCCGLQAAHGQGVVHGDVKPDNVLVDDNGRGKLSDFGIARVREQPSGFTGAVVGTPGYLSPEVLAGASPSVASDVYAVGVMISALCSPLKWPLDTVCRRATAPDPDQRFASAHELQSALLHARSAMQAGALPPEERTWLRTVALLFAAASGLALWALLQSISPVIVTPHNDIYALVRMMTRTLPDGRVISYARLEIGATLAAIAAFAVAGAAYGLLRQHWRKYGLEDPRPNRPLKEGRHLLLVGLFCVVVFLIRRALDGHPAAFYIPVLGGLLELYMLYVLWTALLEAARTSRSVTREWMLWAGFWLAMVPPACELASYVRNLG